MPGYLMDSFLRITEIFFSIQGESSFSGWPCVMVRLSGCNLRCSWCDTEYSFAPGGKRSLSEIMEEVGKFPGKRVEITGGEPLLQQATPLLAQSLLSSGYTVLCETSGERDISILPEAVHRIMDLKAPKSGESPQNRLENLAHLKKGRDEIKIVVQDREDFDWSLEMIEKHDLMDKALIQMSPVFGKLEGKTLAEWILASQKDIRLNLQLHKFLWGNEPGH